MTHWKSYHLLTAALQGMAPEPARLFAWGVRRVVDGFVDHDTYQRTAECAARRAPSSQRLEQQMALLIAIDANPVAELMLTAPDAASFAARWNGFHRAAPVGVETRLSNGQWQREDRIAGAQDALREQVMAACLHAMDVQRAGALREEAPQRLRLQLAGLGLMHAVLHDCLDQLQADPEASLDDCAAALGCTRRTLQRELTRLGLRFALLRQAVRLGIAGHAMRSAHDESLTAIAHSAGFFDAAHLVRAWKTSCGVTPSTYRALARGAA